MAIQLLQPDGKIVVAGYSTNSDYMLDFATVRYNSDGSLDSSFGENGVVITTFGNDGGIATSVAIQSDSKIIVTGCSSCDFAIVRYNTDGTIDNSFGGDGIVTTDFAGGFDLVNSLAIQTDGKIIAAGWTRDTNYLYNFAIARYTLDGSLDSSFGASGKVITTIGNGEDEGNSVDIQLDGKIIVAGNSSGDFAIVRYNINGSLDNYFGTNGIVITDINGTEDRCYSVAIQSDGKIVAGGTDSSGFAIVRYDTNSTLDNSFGTSGKITTDISNSVDIGNSIAIQTDNKIVVAGGAYYSLAFYPSEYDYFEVVRYNSDGTLDSSFGSMGKVISVIGDGGSTCNSVAIQTDGNIVAAGVSYNNSGLCGAEDEFTVVRYISDLNIGMVDFSYESNPILVYPNPIQKDVMLEYTLTKDEFLTIEIYDINGRLVKSIFTNENRNKGTHKELLNIEKLQAGIYILSIKNNLRSQNIKIVKE
ncbi:MAG: T9SS type A sorting domain-containing protein [Bacteroidia bacterium]|nr:T9SS type A sorting domain-containing protein [Bacteroidia bacterium]